MVYIPHASILVAFFLIQLPRFFVGAEMKKQAGGYDNHDPRGQQAKLDGRGKRALGAHNNAIEAFPPFAAGVLMCASRGASLNLVVGLCVGFVVVRTAHIFLYLADKPSGRSATWTLGMLATAALMVLAIKGP